MSEGPAIRVSDLTYWYPRAGAPALVDVSLEVERGQFVLLVGASGSGKSTLLRALNGLVPRYHGGRIRGRVEVHGMRAGERPIGDLAQKVGLVFQDPERQAVMTRVDNEVAFGLESLGVPPDTITARVHSALQAVALGDRGSDLVSELSAGQAQRLALASVLVTRPEVLALDEPTSQLDPVGADEFLEHLKRERRTREVTVLLSEHRLERCLPLADRVLVLSEGRLVYDGDPSGYLRGDWAADNGASLPALADAFRGRPPPPMDVGEARARLERLVASGTSVAVRPREAPPAGDVAVRCEDLRFSYDGAEVLRGTDLEVHTGEVLALVGPNGAGKTTLVKHMNGLLRPSGGRLTVLGREASRSSVAELARDVAILMQNPGDYLFERTVEAELHLTARYRGMDDSDGAREVSEAVEELELGGLLDRFSWDLSAGQRQRVALGALLVGAPTVIVLDEPTRGMDGDHKAALATLARQLTASGKGVVIVTHDMEFVGRAADRWAVMEAGEVVVSGPPGEVFEARPAYRPTIWRATEGLALGGGRPALSPGELSIGPGEGTGGGAS